MKRYEVESELNPKYLETGSMTDYYDLYHVVEIDNDGTKRILKTFNGEWFNARYEAYRYANKCREVEALP